MGSPFLSFSFSSLFSFSLFFLFFLFFFFSGLSMVDWKPIMGVFPPRTVEEWTEKFELYKQYPEYKELNQDMDLEGFKEIFYWEYVHRMLGRTIGLLYNITFRIFLFKKKDSPRI